MHTLKNDRWIAAMAAQGLLEPFEPRLVRVVEEQRVISYGLSSYGYDLRLSAKDFRVFRHIPGTVVDPKQFNPANLEVAPLHRDPHGEFFILPAHSYGLGVAYERLNVPDNITVICIGKSTYARCFRGDTRVALVNGTARTLEDMAERSQQGELFWGYSIGPHGRLMVTLLEQPRYIGHDSLIEILLDNDESIFCTPDHPFLTRDGRMVEAHQLRSQDALMPLYRHLARGYEMVYQPLNGHLYPTHRLSDEWNIRHGLYADRPNSHRHHIDFNRLNNNPWNLTRMDATEHIRMHDQRSYGEDFDPEEYDQAIRESIQQRMQDAEWRERFVAQRSPETREAHRQGMLRHYQDAQARALTGQLAKQAWGKDDGSRRDKQSRFMKALSDRLKTRTEIVREVLDRTGSIRGAARYLDCDRSVFRRFPEVIEAFQGRGSSPIGYKNHKVATVREVTGTHDVYCLTVPEAGNFALEAGVFVHNCGIIANLTPAEAGWRGHLTLEFSNSSSADCRIYAGEGVVQLLFLEGEPCAVSYDTRRGKYQDQAETVTLAKA